MTEQPRAKTAEEIRDEFMTKCVQVADYWATVKLDAQNTTRGRILGALHSWLCIIDGVSASIHAFDLVASPHPDDKEFHRADGENWSEPGTIINDCMLHDLLPKYEAVR